MVNDMEDLRMIQRITKIPMWKIAEAIGIAESTLYIWMRKHNAEHHDKIMKAMKELNPLGVEKAIKFIEEFNLNG